VSAATRLDDAASAVGAIVADLDGDLRSDLLLLSPGKAAQAFTEERNFEFQPRRIPEGISSSSLVVLDIENDGDLDLTTFEAGRIQAFLRQPDGTSKAQDLETIHAFGEGLHCILPADFDGDGKLDLLATRRAGPPLVFLGRTETDHQWFGVELVGMREDGKMRANPGGIGSRVTVVAGVKQQTSELLTSYGVLGCASPRLHFGLARSPQVDLLSIAWPDDLIQGEGLIPANQVRTFSQVYRKSSSCPLLFAWDGERYQFVTDFLGVGGLGFFIAPGIYAPPDPTERVLLPDLVAKDGFYALSIHEAMEEILYLDQAFLWVIDHPAELEVLPDERLAIEGAPPADRFFIMRTEDRSYPKALVTIEGAADPKCLLDADRVYQPGVHPDRRFLGFAAPQEIVLDFGGELSKASDAPLVLCIDGWVEYPYSHVNFAAAQAGLALKGLGIDVEVSAGVWEPYVSDLGYPAGMPRIMTFELAGMRRDGTGRIRLTTNVELYMDRLWLARDLAQDPSIVASVRTTKVLPSSARLRPSGYPREYSPDGKEPLLYDYQLMDPAIDYKTMAGAYTRFGDVMPLLQEADNQTIIMGRAEEVLLEFPEAPVKADGYQRTFILDSTGFCKDMDLYTAYPSTVDPLPYLGMPSYPYSPSEGFPRTNALKSWHTRYNTRNLSGISDGRTSQK
jgi:hypothetical protein